MIAITKFDAIIIRFRITFFYEDREQGFILSYQVFHILKAYLYLMFYVSPSIPRGLFQALKM
jgi:hypothetical protein